MEKIYSFSIPTYGPHARYGIRGSWKKKYCNIQGAKCPACEGPVVPTFQMRKSPLLLARECDSNIFADFVDPGGLYVVAVSNSATTIIKKYRGAKFGPVAFVKENNVKNKNKTIDTAETMPCYYDLIVTNYGKLDRQKSNISVIKYCNKCQMKTHTPPDFGKLVFNGDSLKDLDLFRLEEYSNPIFMRECVYEDIINAKLTNFNAKYWGYIE